MPWQELGHLSQQDIDIDDMGYISFTRVFKLWDVTPTSFWSHIDAIPEYGTGGTGQPASRHLPQYGDTFDIRQSNNSLAPFLNQNETDFLLPGLHKWTLRPEALPTYYAIAHYSNDPRLVAIGGVDFHSTPTQITVPIPFARQAPVATGGNSDTANIAFMECSLQLPMSVENIAHSVMVPRKQIKEYEKEIEERVGQLHQLPIKQAHSPALYVGADISMRGPQWLAITHNWQWQSGVYSVSFTDMRNVDDHGVNAPTPRTVYPPKVQPLTSEAFGTDRYILPPYHSMEMYFTTNPGIVPRFVYRMPYAADGQALIGWKSLPGAEYFIWGIGP